MAAETALVTVSGSVTSPVTATTLSAPYSETKSSNLPADLATATNLVDELAVKIYLAMAAPIPKKIVSIYKKTPGVGKKSHYIAYLLKHQLK